MRYLVKFDFGLDDAFGKEIRLLTSDELKFLKDNTGTRIYLGEIEGKHSEVSGPLNSEDYVILSEYPDDSDFVKEFDKHFKLGIGIDIFNALNIAVSEKE